MKKLIIEILHIEDDLADAVLMQKILNKNDLDHKDYIITHCLNLKEAIKELEAQHNFDIILLDMNIPDGNKIENIEVIKNISPNLPIIIVTSEKDETIAAKALQAGAQECIVKSSATKAVMSRIIQSSILRNKKQIELSHKAYFDDLTDLPNRQNFENSARAMLANNIRWKKRSALMFIDLNKFKFINDTYGHQAGNTVLKTLADRLKQILRDSDLIARYAGDEFVICLNSGNTPITEELCVKISQKIIALAERPINLGEKEIEISLSIGIALFPDAGKTFDALLKNADIAMYEAKKSSHTHYKIISNHTRKTIPPLSKLDTNNTRQKILIVDDNKLDLKLYKEHLKDYEIIEALNAHDAFKILENTTPACIVLDYLLPDTENLSFLDTFQSLQHKGKVPIILLTTQEDRKTAIQAMKKGVKDYLIKGEINKASLNKIINHAIEEQRLINELALKQTELERYNKDLYDFSNTVAHDLKSPIRKISMFCDLILEEEDIQNNKNLKNHIQRMSVNAHRMNHLIKSLLDYVKIQNHKKEKKIIPLDILTKDVISELSTSPKIKDVTINLGKMPSWPVHQNTMRQLLVNLTTNAIKYRKKNQKTIIEINAEVKNDNCIISVKDNGQGIESKQISNIFKPFHRLHNNDEIEGTGLGLSICSKIAKEHNGQIYVESTKGIGSTFFTSLPRS